MWSHRKIEHLTMVDLLNEGSMAHFGSKDADRRWYEGADASPTKVVAPEITNWERYVRFPDSARNLPIWSWTHDPGTPNKVTDLRCRTRGMKFMDMSVVKEITWDDPKVRYQGNDYTLPLTQQYLIRRCQISKGEIPNSESGLWRLEAKLDQSLLQIFGYVLANGELRPMRPDWSAPGIMKPPYTPSVYRPVHVFESEDTMQYVATVNDSFRILVLMELVCCKERDDFEPLGVASMARLYPMLNVVANDELEHLEASIRVHRSRLAGCRNMPGSEHMSPDIRAGVWADTNTERAASVLGVPLFPAWDSIFDYYDQNPSGALSPVVRPEAGRRTMKDAINALEISARTLGVMATYVDRDVLKVARQGGWDNIHLAPGLRLSPEDGQFDLSMAPVCAHDCLHTHWRWGEMWKDVVTGDRTLRGWGKEPFEKVGAPMVPTNQKVDIAVERGSDHIGYRYKVEISSSMLAGHWQPLNHHGAAYAVSMDSNALSDALKKLEEIRGVFSGSDDFHTLDEMHMRLWALFYGAVQRELSVSTGTLGRPRLVFPNGVKVLADG